MAGAAIEVQDLVKVFPRRGHEDVRAVDGLSLEVPHGAIFPCSDQMAPAKPSPSSRFYPLEPRRPLFRLIRYANPITWHVSD